MDKFYKLIEQLIPVYKLEMPTSMIPFMGFISYKNDPENIFDDQIRLQLMNKVVHVQSRNILSISSNCSDIDNISEQLWLYINNIFHQILTELYTIGWTAAFLADLKMPNVINYKSILIPINYKYNFINKQIYRKNTDLYQSMYNTVNVTEYRHISYNCSYSIPIIDIHTKNLFRQYINNLTSTLLSYNISTTRGTPMIKFIISPELYNYITDKKYADNTIILADCTNDIKRHIDYNQNNVMFFVNSCSPKNIILSMVGTADNLAFIYYKGLYKSEQDVYRTNIIESYTQINVFDDSIFSILRHSISNSILTTYVSF